MAIQCDNCSKVYKTHITFQNHINKNRCKTLDISVNCRVCNKTFSDKYGRKRHEKTCGVIKNQDSEIKKLEEKIENMENRIITILENKI